MFANKKQDKNPISPIGLFNEEELKNIVKMLSFFSYAQWVCMRDQNDPLKTHFMLGKGALTVDTIATMSSYGAYIDSSGDALRIFKIDMGLLAKTYYLQQNELKNNHLEREKFFGVHDRVALRESIDMQVAEQFEASGCRLM